jgi:hypothetical protein
MITSTIHVLILVPVFFVLMKERELERGMPLAVRQNSQACERQEIFPSQSEWLKKHCNGSLVQCLVPLYPCMSSRLKPSK